MISDEERRQRLLLAAVMVPIDAAAPTWVRKRKTKLRDGFYGSEATRAEIISLYVSFLAGKNNELGRAVFQRLSGLRGLFQGTPAYAALLDETWMLCVADASLRMPDFKP